MLLTTTKNASLVNCTSFSCEEGSYSAVMLESTLSSLPRLLSDVVLLILYPKFLYNCP